MAVTVTPDANNDVFKGSWDIEATADGDVAAVVPHGFGSIPVDIQLVPLAAEFYVSAPTVGVVDATNINLVLLNAVGSGAAGNQIRVCARVSPEPW